MCCSLSIDIWPNPCGCWCDLQWDAAEGGPPTQRSENNSATRGRQEAHVARCHDTGWSNTAQKWKIENVFHPAAVVLCSVELHSLHAAVVTSCVDLRWRSNELTRFKGFQGKKQICFANLICTHDQFKTSHHALVHSHADHHVTVSTVHLQEIVWLKRDKCEDKINCIWKTFEMTDT